MGKRLSLAAIACLIACGPPARNDDGGGDDDGSGGADASVGDDGCADGTELIYTIDQFNNRLSQFDPATKTFHDLGSLSCPTMLGATPFSMSVDRNANAWVLYTSGELFKVAIGSGLQCTKLAWTSPNGLKVFGMGFSTDVAGRLDGDALRRRRPDADAVELHARARRSDDDGGDPARHADARFPR